VLAKSINDVKVLDESLPILGNQRQVVRWAFEEDRKALDVKRFALSSGGYIIVQIASLKEAGIPNPDEVDGFVTAKVLKEKKKAMLLKQIDTFSTLEDLASQFDLTVSSSKAVNRFTSMLSGAAQEPEVVGAGFGLDLNDISEPIAGESGVFVVQPKAFKEAEELSNYAGYKASIANTAKQNTQTFVADALKGNYEITDNRSLYY
jgi:peptidyl-prolyl cis-trans isomerase D